MNPDPNPYAAPTAQPVEDARTRTRTQFLLAGVGACLAALWWGLVAVLAFFGSRTDTPPLQVVLPVVLVGLYGFRGLQLFKGDVRAAQRLIYLHAVGAVVAILQMSSNLQLVVVFNGVKAAINVFGALTAYWARKTYIDIATNRD